MTTEKPITPEEMFAYLDEIHVVEIVTDDGMRLDVDPDGWGFQKWLEDHIRAVREDEEKLFWCATLIKVDQPTPGGRVYSEAVLREAIEKAQDKIRQRKMFVCNPGYETTKTPPLDQTVGVVKGLRIKQGALEVQVEALRGSERFQAVDPASEGRIASVSGGPVKVSDLEFRYFTKQPTDTVSSPAITCPKCKYVMSGLFNQCPGCGFDMARGEV